MADNDRSDRLPLEVVGASLKLCLPSHGCDGGVAPARHRVILLCCLLLIDAGSRWDCFYAVKISSLRRAFI